jgi:hypothetical protein
VAVQALEGMRELVVIKFRVGVVWQEFPERDLEPVLVMRAGFYACRGRRDLRPSSCQVKPRLSLDPPRGLRCGGRGGAAQGSAVSGHDRAVPTTGMTPEMGG